MDEQPATTDLRICGKGKKGGQWKQEKQEGGCSVRRLECECG